MQTKVSGAKTVIVPITGLGKNYFPFVEYLKDRYIKYVDCILMSTLPGSGDAITTTTGAFVNLAIQAGNTYFVSGEPLDRYDIEQNLGIRKPINRKMSLQNSFINVTNSALVGKSVVLVFWYDLPEYSKRNRTTETIVDSFEVSLVQNSGRNQFPDNRTMVGKRFRNMYLTYPTTTPTYADGITDVQSKNIYVTFQKGNYCVLDQLPLPLLYQIGLLEGLSFANIVFDFTYSFAFVGGGGTLTGYAGKSIFLNAVYENQ